MAPGITRILREKVGPCPVWVLVTIAAVFIFGGADWVMNATFYPWALAEPPLLDRWVGRLTTGAGDHLDISLVLRRAEFSRGRFCAKCNQLEGSAATCDARGNVRRYRISGSPEDRHGHRLRLGAVPAQDPPPQGLELDTLGGTWDGAHTLTLEADFFWRRGNAAVSSTDDPATQPVPLRMERKGAAAFEGPCAQIM